jgi:hypothetical protein
MRMIVLLLEECPLKIEEDTEVIGVMAVLVVVTSTEEEIRQLELYSMKFKSILMYQLNHSL